VSRSLKVIAASVVAIAGLSACANGVVAQSSPVAPATSNATVKTIAAKAAPVKTAAQVQADADLARFYAQVEYNTFIDGLRNALQQNPTLTCIRHRESDRSTYPYVHGYGAISGDRLYYGAYQFLPSTWNNAARQMGRLDLVGVLPSQVVWYDQDQVAKALLDWEGMAPWGGSCHY
jgi:hypothetical protein